MAQNQKENQENSNRNKLVKDFAKYSGLAFQMGATIGLMAWLGVSLDEHYDKNPLFTSIFSLAGVFASLWVVLKSLIK